MVTPRRRARRLTDDEVVAIHRYPGSPTKAAEAFGVPVSTASRIKSGFSYRHLGLGATAASRRRRLTAYENDLLRAARATHDEGAQADG